MEKTMMRKYGVENINEHFISFNTICNATQVSTPLFLLHSCCTCKRGRVKPEFGQKWIR